MFDDLSRHKHEIRYGALLSGCDLDKWITLIPEWISGQVTWKSIKDMTVVFVITIPFYSKTFYNTCVYFFETMVCGEWCFCVSTSMQFASVVLYIQWTHIDTLIRYMRGLKAKHTCISGCKHKYVKYTWFWCKWLPHSLKNGVVIRRKVRKPPHFDVYYIQPIRCFMVKVVEMKGPASTCRVKLHCY